MKTRKYNMMRAIDDSLMQRRRRASPGVRSSRCPARGGYSLVELLIVISILTFVLMLCGMTLQSLFRLDRVGRHDTLEARTLDRLAESFRTDAHAAVGSQTEGGALIRSRDFAGRLVHPFDSPAERGPHRSVPFRIR